MPHCTNFWRPTKTIIFTFAAGGDSDDFYYNYDCTTALDKMAMINAIKEVRRKGDEQQFSHNNACCRQQWSSTTWSSRATWSRRFRRPWISAIESSSSWSIRYSFVNLMNLVFYSLKLILHNQELLPISLNKHILLLKKTLSNFRGPVADVVTPARMTPRMWVLTSTTSFGLPTRSTSLML